MTHTRRDTRIPIMLMPPRMSAETKIDTAITVSTRRSRAAKKDAQKDADSKPMRFEPVVLKLPERLNIFCVPFRKSCLHFSTANRRCQAQKNIFGKATKFTNEGI